jgi:ATP synthase protein I
LQAAPTTNPDADPPEVSTPAVEELSLSLVPPPSVSVSLRTAESCPVGSPTDGSSIGGSGPGEPGMDHFQRLQRRIILATVVTAALAVPVTFWFFGASTAFSLLVGSVAALLYLKLLARSVSRLGVATKSVGKAQLLVPLLLVLAASRLPQLEVLPALVGFLLYKPALIIQALLDG